MPQVSLANADAPLVLALDIGTSSVRALLFDRQCRAIEESEAQHPYEITTTPDGGAEADAKDVFAIVLRCLDGATQFAGNRADEIAGVGASCFWHSLLGLDADGTPITPVLYWGDTRSVVQVDRLRGEIDPAALHARTGCPLHSSFWPAKLRWLRDRDEASFNRVAHWCSFAEYLRGRLHGPATAQTSISMSSGTGMLNVHYLDWDSDLQTITGIRREQLPTVIDFDTPAIGLLPDYAGRWPALSDIPWYPALGDGVCANVGGGATSPARLALTLGTSGAMRMVTTDVHLKLPDRLWMYLLDRTHGVLGGALSNGGNLTAWLRDLLGHDHTTEVWQRASRMAPDSHGLTMLPFVAGERAPSWNAHAHGVIAGLTLATEPVDLFCAAMETVAYRFALIYEQLAPSANQPHQIVAGGAAILNSPDWLQIVADVLNHEVMAPDPDEEASARGAAVAALVALQVFPSFEATPDPVGNATVYRPDTARHQIYRAAIDRHVRLESLLFPDGSDWTAATPT